MGCGASKSVNVQAGSAPVQQAPAAAPQQASVVVVVQAKPATPKPVDEAVTVEVIVPAPAATVSNKEDKTVGKETGPDSGLENNDDDIAIPADEAEEADCDRPPTPDLTIVGTKANSRLRAALSAVNNETDLDDTERESSASTTRSAVISERPSSRGGMAFDMTFDGEQSRTRAPARLEKLRTRTRSAEMTVDELKDKLVAAEARREAYEKRLKEKLSKETEKVEKVQQQHAVDTSASLKSNQEDKESKVLENREANLRKIREKLKAREEHARKVREAKRLSSSSLPEAVPVN
jgi:hypothetical protein